MLVRCACFLLSGSTRCLHAHSTSTVGGGFDNRASLRCVLAVSAQRVVYRSCFVQVILSVTVSPCACVQSLSSATVLWCVCCFCLSDSTRPRRCCTACWRPGVVLASHDSRRPVARAAAAVCLLFFCRFLPARSYSTIGGGSGNGASGACVLAVAAQRRSCFVHVCP